MARGRRTRALIGCLAAAVAVGSCAGGGHRTDRTRPTGRAPAPTGCAAERARLGHDPRLPGAPLATILRVPAGERHPLIVAFHGQGDSGPLFEDISGLTYRAEAAGFAIAYPDAPAASAWRVPRDLAVTRATLAVLASNPCVDAHRIYAVGFSAGGRMAAGLACTGADLRGYVGVSGGIPPSRRCRPARRLDVLEVHGTADPVVPYYGKPGARWRAEPAWIGAWARRDGCAHHPLARRTSATVTRFRWPRCRGGHRVELVRIAGAQHGWYPRDLPSRDVNATEETVRFLSR